MIPIYSAIVLYDILYVIGGVYSTERNGMEQKSQNS